MPPQTQGAETVPPPPSGDPAADVQSPGDGGGMDRIRSIINKLSGGGTPAINKALEAHHAEVMAQAQRHSETAKRYYGLVAKAKASGQNPLTGKPATPEEIQQWQQMGDGAWADYTKIAGKSKQAKPIIAQVGGLLKHITGQQPAQQGSQTVSPPPQGSPAPAQTVPPPPNPMQEQATGSAIDDQVKTQQATSAEQTKADIGSKAKISEEDAKTKGRTAEEDAKHKHKMDEIDEAAKVKPPAPVRKSGKSTVPHPPGSEDPMVAVQARAWATSGIEPSAKNKPAVEKYMEDHDLKPTQKATVAERKLNDDLKKVEPMVDTLEKFLEDNKLTNAGQGGMMSPSAWWERSKVQKAWEEYSHGLPPKDKKLGQLIKYAAAIKIMGAAPWMSLGRGKYLYSEVVQHLPEPTDTPAQLYEKVQFFRTVLDDARGSLPSSLTGGDTGAPANPYR